MELVQYSPEYWLALAAECHAVADRMSHQITKQTMLRLARGYERLARHAQEQAGMITPTQTTKEGSE
jgi:hypothetical protein